MCQRCGLGWLCLCSEMPVVTTSLEFLVVRHVREARKTVETRPGWRRQPSLAAGFLTTARGVDRSTTPRSGVTPGSCSRLSVTATGSRPGGTRSSPNAPRLFRRRSWSWTAPGGRPAGCLTGFPPWTACRAWRSLHRPSHRPGCGRRRPQKGCPQSKQWRASSSASRSPRRLGFSTPFMASSCADRGPSGVRAAEWTPEWRRNGAGVSIPVQRAEDRCENRSGTVLTLEPAKVDAVAHNSISS